MTTRSMTKAVLTAAMGTALSLLLGPATTTSQAWANPPAPLQLNPFAGSWFGPGTVDGEPVGTLDFTISDTGRLTGRVYHLQDDQSGELVGHVGADGFVTLINFVPSDNPSEHNNGTALQGWVVTDGNDTVVAVLTGRFVDGFTVVAILERY